jgi:hypothetical protein
MVGSFLSSAAYIAESFSPTIDVLDVERNKLRPAFIYQMGYGVKLADIVWLSDRRPRKTFSSAFQNIGF